MACKFFKFIWPTLGNCDDKETENDIKIIKEDGIQFIKDSTWKNKPEIFLEEARRLRDNESARRASAETKGKIYLGATLALISVGFSVSDLTTFKHLFTNLNTGTNFSSGFFVLGFIIYSVSTLFFAFEILKVSSYRRVDIKEIVKAAKSNKPFDRLIREILLSVRWDRTTINQKIGLVRVTEGHFKRMVFMFIVGLFLWGIWPQIKEIVQFIIVPLLLPM
ncbi:MAG: hypothetical protein HRT36_06630 [Alphaproteobacteria bacterium]|nr:hypothetical protein [Alphaproteobacteria bacterium]